MKGISSPASAAIIGVAMILLSIYTVYTVINTATSLHSLVDTRVEGRDILRVVNVDVYSNGTAYIAIANEGSVYIEVKDIEIAIAIYIDGNPYIYSLKQCSSLEPGCWCVEGIAVKDIVYSSSVLRPGEVIYIAIKLPIEPPLNSYGYISVFSLYSKAERVFTVSR